MANEQNIISIGYDLDHLTPQQKIVIDFLQATYDLAEKIDGRKIAPDISGWGDMTKAIKTVDDAFKDYNKKVDEQRQKLADLEKEQTKYNETKSKEAVELEKVKILRQQQIKANKEEALAALGLVDEYKKLNTQYEQAARNAQNLAVKHGINSKEAKDAAAAAKELSDKLKAIDDSVGKNQRNVGNYKDGFKGLGDVGKNAIDKIDNGFKSFFKNVAVSVASFIGIQSIFNFIENSISAFEKSEQSIKREENALKNLGASASDINILSKSVDDLTTKYTYLSKIDLRESQQKLITYGKLTAEQINGVQGTIVQFAANARIGIPEATELIIKALEGNARALKVYGINIKDASSFSERFALIQGELADKVKGSADVFAQSSEGKVETYKRQLGSLRKEIGEQLMPVYEEFLSLSLNGIKLLKELNFGNILKGVVALTAAWGVYKAIMLANNIITSISNSLLVANAALSQGVAVKKMLETTSEEVNTAAKSSNIIVTYALIAAKKTYILITEAATVATRVFSTVIKSTPIGWLLTGIGLLVGAVAAYGASLKSSTNAINENSEALERNKRIKELNAELDVTVKKNMIEQKSVIDELVGKIKNHNLSLGDRKKALNELIDLDPNYLRGLSLENIETEKGKKLLDDYVSALERKARAEAIKDKYKEAYSSYVDNNKKEQDAADKAEKIGNAVSGYSHNPLNDNYDPLGEIIDRVKLKSSQKEFNEAHENTTQSDRDMQYYKGLMDNTITNDVQFNQQSGLGKYADDGKEKVKKEKDWLSEIMKAREEVAKEQIEQEKLKAEQLKKTFEDIANDEKQSFENRKEGLMGFAINSKRIIDLQTQQEESELNDKLNEIERIEKKSADKRTEEEKKLLIERNALLEKQKTLELKYAIEVENIQLDIAKRMAQLANKQSDEAQKRKEDESKEQEGRDKYQIDKIGTNLLKSQTDLIEEETDKLAALNRKYLEGKISVEEYNKAKQKLSEDFEVKNLDIEIASKENLISTLKKIARSQTTNTDAKYLSNIQSQITQAENQLANLEKNKTEKQHEGGVRTKKSAEEQRNIAIQSIQYAQQLQSSIQSLVDDGYQQELNAIQHKKDLLDESAQTELQNIEKSNLSQQDKAAMTVQLQAQQRAADRQLEREQREIKNRQARADRAFAVANIIENTAVAIMKTYAEGGFFGGLAGAIIVGALGAVELATVLAKPIPQYAEGVESHPDGLAVVGEGKNKELVTMPDNKTFIADKPMLVDLPKGTSVQPLTTNDINEIMYSSAMRKTAQLLQNADMLERKKNNENWEIARWQTEQIKKSVRTEIKNKIKVETKIDYGFTEYINKQVFGKD